MTDQRAASVAVNSHANRKAGKHGFLSRACVGAQSLIDAPSQGQVVAEEILDMHAGNHVTAQQSSKSSVARSVNRSSILRGLTQEWGSDEAVSLYLDRCQVDTPKDVVEAVWTHIAERRGHVVKVVDFGAGDGRFAAFGEYETYIGYEIDSDRCKESRLPPHAIMLNQCAFADVIEDADVCIGNPPYVRNQDLPEGWREQAAAAIRERTGVAISGLANAWQYFALLALASTKSDGIVALVIPFEWVSRPSARALRHYVKENKWRVATYRLRDETFHGVLTTSSITLIDKRDTSGRWEYFEERHDGTYRGLLSPSGRKAGVLAYAKRSSKSDPAIFVRRGLSPGTQEVLTLSEGERVRFGLQINLDVVPCITSLRSLPPDRLTLTEAAFRKYFRDKGMKCWLIRTDCQPSARLKAYLESVPTTKRATRTCSLREEWWKFRMPQKASVIVASGFRGPRPKVVINDFSALAVGAVFGVYGLSGARARLFARHIGSIDLTGRVVSHSNGLRKLEPRQLYSLVSRFLSGIRKAAP
jgi:hypothetical protein